MANDNDKCFKKPINLELAFDSSCFHGHAQNDNKCSYIVFLIKYKILNIIMKTGQMKIVLDTMG